MKPLQTLLVAPQGHAALSHPPNVLTRIFREHGEDLHRMVETLLLIGAAADDVELLSRLPWPYLANRIGVERERLGLSAVHPLLDWKLPPPPPIWLTPAVCQKMFELALEYQDGEADRDFADPSELILPA